MPNMSSLFLTQSYNDAYDDYMRTLTHEVASIWDYIIITASNEHQAKGFRAQLQERESAGLLPARTKFAVIPDENGERIGSGGATLGVLRYIAEDRQSADFSGLCVLVIHSGGDSKRIPQYSAMGKLFSPVPHELRNGRASSLFDELMIAMSSVPSRIREGMMLLSGDVLPLFNPLQIDFSGRGAAAVSFKEDVNTGKEHGVYLRGESGNVQRFLHKQTVETLKACGAVNENNCVDIDTGAVIFSAEMLRSLYGLISENGAFSMEKYAACVNTTVRLSLYGDFLYPLAEDSTLEQFYSEKPEGTLCDELMRAREEVWKCLRPYRMKLLRLAPAKFIHFGTTEEIMTLMSSGIDAYADLGWNRHVNSSINGDTAGYNSVLSAGATIGKNCYLENSYVHHRAQVGDNTMLSFIDVVDEKIPSNVVLHGLKQNNGKFVVRIFGVADNPKGDENAPFLGGSLRSMADRWNIASDELWDGIDRTIWTAKLFPVCDRVRDAVAATLNLCALMQGEGDLEMWRNAERRSLCESFNDADQEALIAWDKRMHELVRMDRIAMCIHNTRPASECGSALNSDKLTPIQNEWLERRLNEADFSESIRLEYYIGRALGGMVGNRHIGECFRRIQQAILKSALDELSYNDKCRICRESHCVELPLRINWGGGWSDTPPYCNEKGGTVLNAAITLNGSFPVQVKLTRLDAPVIVFESRDMDVYGEFREIGSLQQTGDPYDPFALQKSALLACGIIPREGGNLADILGRLGGGFILKSEVTGVPKGSGLGTSSILAAACVKALLEFVGVDYSEDEIYSRVLCMEQIMTTGGGWQDQIGGVTPGIKFITSAPGIRQNPCVEHVALSSETLDELRSRFALIYTGQRRLARNLLRDVVGRYIGNTPDSLYALNEIQRIAALMRFELMRGHVDDFAELLNRHWELSKMIDAGTTNTLINQIFVSIEDYISGRMICGAGGGGFLQVILKKGVTKEMLHRRLKEVFGDNDIDVWDCSLI